MYNVKITSADVLEDGCGPIRHIIPPFIWRNLEEGDKKKLPGSALNLRILEYKRGLLLTLQRHAVTVACLDVLFMAFTRNLILDRGIFYNPITSVN